MGIGFVGHPTRSIVVEESSQVGQVRREAQSLAQLAGFAELDAGRVTLAAVEIATNVLRHGPRGLPGECRRRPSPHRFDLRPPG